MDKFSKDKFILNEKNYKKMLKYEKEKEERKDKLYIPKPYTQDKIQYDDKQHDNYNFIDTKSKDMYYIREKGDNLLNNWIIKQKEPIIIFLSDFIPGTKVSKTIEQFRPMIKTTPTISIEEYRKIKKLGEESITYLKRMKDKYGIIVLKVLWANLNF
jgi:acid phosphatase class B